MWEWCLVRNPRFFPGIQTWEEIKENRLQASGDDIIIKFENTFFRTNCILTGICFLVNVCLSNTILQILNLQPHDFSYTRQSLRFLHSVLALSILQFVPVTVYILLFTIQRDAGLTSAFLSRLKIKYITQSSRYFKTSFRRFFLLKARQVYLYSTFHTQRRCKVLYIMH